MRLWPLFAIAVLATCDHQRKETALAKHSLYDTDFAQVYSAALSATRQLYPNLDDHPGPGKIGTAWHQVQLAATTEDLSNQATVAASASAGTSSGSATQANANIGAPTRLATKRFFIRFDVTVLGGRPWRVKVTGHAAEWEPGAAMPNELRGFSRPSWLTPRTEALQRAIYASLRPYAVPVAEEVEAPIEAHMPKADPTAFKGLPPGADTMLANLRVALLRRNYAAVQPLLADDVVWSEGGGVGPEGAMAVWQADPTWFVAMTAALDACATAGARIRCTKEGFELGVELRSSGWRVVSFLPVTR
jgi:hypothetical protein